MDETVEKRTISSELARLMIDAARREATKLDQPSSIAITDESGVLKAFSRMDGAPLLSVAIAQDKAYTAVGMGISTGELYQEIANDPPMSLGAVGGVDRLIAFGGGFPIVWSGEIVGGIGVSGGHYSDDIEIAQAALSAMETSDQTQA